MRIIRIALIILVFVACKSTERQRYKANIFFDKHPAELAAKCDKTFPVKDSVGDPVYDIIKSSSNKNYKATIDSLVEIGENAMIQLLYAKKRADTISEQCADVVLGYMRDVERLQQESKRLQKEYRPCSPDTLTELRIIYRRSMAREVSLKDSLDQILYQLGEMTIQFDQQVDDLSDKDKINSELKSDKNGWMWKAIGTWVGMAIILGGGLFYFIKK